MRAPRIRPTLSEISQLVATVAAATRVTARRACDSIYVHYEGWQPDDTPLDQWARTWEARRIVTSTGSHTAKCLLDFNLTDTCVAILPTFDVTDPLTKARLLLRMNVGVAVPLTT